MAPTLTSPLLSGLVGNLQQFEKPEVPGEPASFKADENLWGHSGVPPKPDLPSPSHDELAKGRLRELSLLTKERAVRISPLWSLNRMT